MSDKSSGGNWEKKSMEYFGTDLLKSMFEHSYSFSCSPYIAYGISKGKFFEIKTLDPWLSFPLFKELRLLVN